MTLPASFTRAGFVTPHQAAMGGRKFRRLMISTEGLTNTGKTEFLLSCPGPGLVICLDRNFDATLDNPNPPISRRDDFAFKVVQAPLNQSAGDFGAAWKLFKEDVYRAIEVPEARTVCIDGDSDSWELQRLAEHGKLTGVFPATRYTGVYAARRAFIRKLWDSGKIIVATNKLKKEYKVVTDDEGKPLPDPNNPAESKREATGEWERQGFPDTQYLWHLHLRHLYQPAGPDPKGRQRSAMWGIRVLSCKANPEADGYELWGADCCFRGLVEVCYPNVNPKEWGL